MTQPISPADDLVTVVPEFYAASLGPVLNQWPAVEPLEARVALVGEAPGRDECHFGLPFAGESGRLLEGALGRCGVSRSQCFVGNVCQWKPSRDSNDFSLHDWEGEKVQAGVAQLRADLERFKPTLVVCLGNAALHLFKNGNVAPRKVRVQGRLEFDWREKVGDWRGSLWESTWLEGVKCLATYHPSAVLRDYKLQGYYRTGVGGLGDFEKLREESKTARLERPQRAIVLNNGELRDVVGTLRGYVRGAARVAVDIEGGAGNVTSIAFATDAGSALVVPLARADGSSYWQEGEEVALWEEIRDVIEDPSVEKIAQNGQYDFFALAWTYGIVVRGWKHDTMLSMWEVFPELDKGLAVQASLFTKEPFYKPDKLEGGELKFESDEEFWRYNGLDACVTFECWEKAMGLMRMSQRAHYEFNCGLLPAVLYMMLRGMRVDRRRVEEEKEKAEKGAWELQVEIDRAACKGDEFSELALLQGVVDGLPEADFAQIVLRCLGGKNPRKRVEVVEERWQPMTFNGKKWKKAGKIVTSRQEHADWPVVEAEPDPLEYHVWLKPMHRTVSKLQSFTPTTLADCEEFILGLDGESDAAKEKQRVWRRVKQIWREIRANESKRQRQAEVDGLPDQRTARQTHGDGDCATWHALLGELSLLLGIGINANSTNAGGDAQRFLYEICGLPRIFQDEKSGRLSKETESEWKKRQAGGKTSIPAGKKISTDQNALDKLYAETQDVRVLWCLQQRRLKKVVSDLDVELDGDGMLRSSISLVKETGRMAASKSPTGTGANAQAWNKDLRRVVVAGEGAVLGQCDLEGADSWTVAAECAALGDPTMLEDLKAGLKPAKVLCLLYLEGSMVNEWSRQQIKARLGEVKLPEWLYPGAKATCHGSSYGMGWQTTSQTLLKNSLSELPLELADAKPIVLSKQQVEKLQGAFFSRYSGVKKWHEKIKRLLLEQGFMEMGPGHVRRFYGRKKKVSRGQVEADHETLKEALSSKPQFFTTYAMKVMIKRLWEDGENRREDGSLRVEPLIPVHDSLLMEWGREDDGWARQRIKSWFENELEIAGVKVVIPADGVVCGDWGMKKGAERL